MISKKNTNNLFIFRLFFISGLAFLFVVLKHILYPVEVRAYFYFFEFIALILFLAVIYLSEKQHRGAIKKDAYLRSNYEKEKENWQMEEEHLKGQIAVLEERETEIQRFASYQEKIFRKLFDEGISKGKHRFLHLLAEAFQAGAAILYKESEPSGHFVVEESYALPDDFIPAEFNAGEGLNGQAVADGKAMLITDLPEEFLPVASGLGNANGRYLYLLPVVKDGRCLYLIEMVTFRATEAERMWDDLAKKIVDKGILL